MLAESGEKTETPVAARMNSSFCVPVKMVYGGVCSLRRGVRSDSILPIERSYLGQSLQKDVLAMIHKTSPRSFVSDGLGQKCYRSRPSVVDTSDHPTGSESLQLDDRLMNMQSRFLAESTRRAIRKEPRGRRLDSQKAGHRVTGYSGI
jgi:hypothetical protein